MIQPRKWSVPLGSGADVQDLPDDDLRYASFSKIFPQITQVPLPAGGVAPRRIDFNSLFKLLADNIYFYQNGGVFEYSDTADYEKGALVRYNDNIYLCIQDNSALNTHNPEEMDYWLRVALNNELADYLPIAGGNLTGNLTVQNKNVVRTVNDIEADVNGNVVIESNVITGSLLPFAGNNIPNGYLLCNGAEVLKDDYSELYSVISDTYGVASSSDKFKLPDLRDRYIIGADTNALGTKIAEQLPNITGDMTNFDSATVGNGAFFRSSSYYAWNPDGESDNDAVRIYFDASRSNSVYTDNGKVYPASIALNFIIKT